MIPIEKALAWLVKFGERDHMEQLQNGELYMHSLQYYIDLEKDKGNRIVGDKYEGKLPIKNVQMTIFDSKTHKEILSLSGSSATFDFGMSKYPVFCSLMFDNENRLLEDENEPIEKEGEITAVFEYGFTEKQRNEMSEFGDTAVIIHNVPEFIRRIEKAAKDAGVHVGHGPVSYYHDNDREHIMQVMGQHGAAPLWKRDKYKDQREYRFYLDCEIADHMILNIGDIHDISALLSAEEFLNGRVCMQAKLNC